MKMPTPSYHSQKPRNARNIVTTSASSRILISGSSKFSISFAQNVSTSGAGSSFVPYLRRDASTSLADNPL